MEGLQLRKVESKDIDLLHHISVLTFVDTYAQDNKPENVAAHIAENLNETQLLSEIADSNSIFYFAELNDEVVGYIKLNKGKAQTESTYPTGGEIERIYVLPAFKGQGIGKKLFHQSVQQIREWNCELVWLGVWEKNKKALQFYKHMGMLEKGTHTFTVGDEDQTDFVMVLDL